MTHTLQQDFEHFLSYSGLSSESEHVKAKLLKAYEANWNRPIADAALEMAHDALRNIRDYRTDVSAEIAARSMRFYAEIALEGQSFQSQNSQEIWGLAVQFAGTQVQWNFRGDQQVLVFETPEAFADCFRDVLCSIQKGQ